MNIHVFLTAAQVDPAVVAGRAAVVIDVIRATSTIAEALANGASAVYPTDSTQDAMKLRASLGPEDTLLCGERKGLKVEGFDLGNSPREFTREVVGGKRLVMSTTNGTRAFLAAAGAARVVSASFMNLGSAANAVAGHEGIVIICAGRGDDFSLDDVVCAGQVAARLQQPGDGSAVLNDAALAAVALAERFPPSAEFLGATAAGRALKEIGLGDDLELCAQCDRHELVPEMTDRIIRC